MLEWLDPKEGKRILDVACRGDVVKIAETRCEVHGIDISEEVINIASLEHFEDDASGMYPCAGDFR